MNSFLFKWAVAATFAEDGDHLTALDILKYPTKDTAKLTIFDKIMAAVTFSEEGLHDYAKNLLKDKRQENTFIEFLNDLGLDHRNCFLITLDA